MLRDVYCHIFPLMNGWLLSAVGCLFMQGKAYASGIATS